MASNTSDAAPAAENQFKKPTTLITVGKVGGKKKFKAPQPPKVPTGQQDTVADIAKQELSATESCASGPTVEKSSFAAEPSPTSNRLPLLSDQVEGEKTGKPHIYPAQKCPYEVPAWAGQPPSDYTLSVLKGGLLVGSEKLTKSPFVVGRHQDCDLVLEHPSISRFHAVLQYRKREVDASDTANPSQGGFYLFDLESTHGTQLNRQAVSAKCYRRVRVGHHIKFGFSSRTFILEGPTEDEEAESELSVTEIIEQRKQRELEIRQALEAERAAKEQADRKREEEEKMAGVSWGIAEDAVDDEDEVTGDVNPFALGGTATNEQLYLDDPKKTLRGWFEREGYELNYHVEEKAMQQFVCKIELPIDTGSGSAIIAEACVTGRKKEAVVQCALEACRILDRHGELRKSHHESRANRAAAKNWKQDDYYGSDEDEFLDRTGELANKREQRKARLENKTQTVETFDSLKKKIEVVENSIKEINEALEKSKAIDEANKKAAGESADSLDSFMKQLKAGAALDKAKRSQLRLDLARLTSERLRLIRLFNIAKPTELPPLKPMAIGGTGSGSSVAPLVGAMRSRKRPVLPLTGMPAKVLRMQMDNVVSDAQRTEEKNEAKQDEDDDDEEEEEEEECGDDDGQRKNSGTSRDAADKAEPSQAGNKVSEKVMGQTPSANKKSDREPTSTDQPDTHEAKPTELKKHAPVKFRQLQSSTTSRRMIGPTLPPDMRRQLAEQSEPSKSLDEGEPKVTSASSKGHKSLRIQPTLNAAMVEKIRKCETTGSDEPFEDWVAPAGQTGNGRTLLNDKFGY